MGVPNGAEPARERRALLGDALFEALDEAVLLHDADGRILDANAAASRLFGHGRDALLGMTTRDLEAPGDADGRGGPPPPGKVTREGRYRTRGGGAFPAHATTTPVAAESRPLLLTVVRDLTDYKRAEEERDRFFTLSRDLFCVAGFDGYFKRVNPAWEAVLGYTPADLTAEPFVNFIHPEDRERTRAELAHLAAGQETFSFENRYRCKDGTYKWLLWTAAPLVAEQVVYAAARNITRRKQAEDEIRKANAFLDSVVENIPDMIFVKDAAELRFERINRAGEKLLGLRRDELLGKNDYDLFPRDQAEFFVAKDREVLAGRKTLEITEEEIKTREGRRVIHTKKMPILDEAGVPRYLLGISEDITERRALEETRRRYAEAQEQSARELAAKNEALADSERRYRQLTEASLDAVVVADQQGRITLFNPSAERTFGYAAAEVLGGPLRVLLPEELRGAHEQGFRRYLETRRAVVVGRTVELRGRRKDGTEFPLELSLNAVDLGGEIQFVGAVRDLTERNRMRAMLVQSEKLASIGLLSAGVAHEINNPLAYVANNLVVLERDLKGLLGLLGVYEAARDRLASADPDAARRAAELADEIDLPYVRENLDRILGRTREGVQRVSRIVQGLRGLARTDRPQLEPASLPDLVEASLELVRGRMQRRGIKVEVDDRGTPRVLCVPTQVGQVVLNLLVNALQAVEAAGRGEDGHIAVTLGTDGDEALIEVSDNGGGIDPKSLPHIFDPFYTTKPVGEGTGLGLSITHGIVTGHGGRIEVDSRPDHGTRFRVRLPLNPQRGTS